MAILLTGTTIGGHSAIHAGNLATHGIVTTSNIGSYAITSIPTSFSSITVTSSFDTASADIYASMRVIRNNASSADGMYIGYGNSGSGITRIFGGGSTSGALEKYATYTVEPGSFRAPIFYDSVDTSYYLDPNSTSYLYHLVLSGNSYFRPNSWIEFNGNYGLYWPNNYGLHIYPNNSGSYGALQINGTKGGWAGIHFDGSANTLMANANESGFHRQGIGWQFRWTEGTMYVHRGTNGGGTAHTVLDTGNYNSFSIPTKQYIWSRGENLLTNGTGLLGNNTNFSSFTFDGSQAYFSSGSFRYTGQYQAPNTDELMPVNPEKRYRLDFWARTTNGQGAYYAFLNFFDVDGNAIIAPFHMYYANTLTTLAQTLNPGDTVAYLTSVANWENGGTAGVSTHIRSFIFWNYTNSFGYTYPPQTYSRNWYSDAWNPGAINSGNNTITLRVPWSGPSIAAGTQVSNGSAGGTFKYIALGYTIVPTTWTNYVGIMDGVDYSGTNAGGQFPPGTAAAKLGFLTDYNASGDTIYLANLFVGVDNDYPIYDRWTGNTRINKAGAFYGTIFYDSNNDGYYLDPNSTSNLYRVDAAAQMRAPIFYDSQDTNYYLDPNSTSRLDTVNANTLRSYGNVYTDGNFGHGLVGLYNSTRYQGVFAMGDSYKLTADGTGTGTLYGIAWTHTNVGGQSKSGLGHQALFMDNGVTQTAIGSGIWTAGLITTTSYGTSANWKSAYDWGNHASADYIVRGTQIASSASWTTATRFGSVGDISQDAGNHALSVRSENGNDAFMSFHIGGDYAVHFGLDDATNRLHTGGWSDGAVKYQLWDSRDFTSSNISNWSTAYSWGNHASAGYLTGITSGQVTGALGYTPYNSSNPNGYITGYTETNTFLGDGGAADTHPGTSRLIFTGQVSSGADTLGMPANDNSNAFLNINRHPGEYNSQLGFSSNGSMYYRSFSATAINNSQAWRQVWDSGNLTNLNQLTNGPGYITSSALSGYATQSYVNSQGFLTSLPSHNHDDRYYTETESDGRYAYKAGAAGQDFSVDKLSSYYLRNHYGVSTNHSYGMYFDNDLSTAYGIFRESGAWDHPYPDLRIAFHTGIKLGANSSYQGIRFYTDYDMTTQVMSVNNGSDPLGAGNVYVNNSLQAGSSLRAPIFYDSQNTDYYVDPNSTSRINSTIIYGGTSGTSPRLTFMTTDDGDTNKYIGMVNYWTQIGCHVNEGLRLINSNGVEQFYVRGGTSGNEAWFRGNVTASGILYASGGNSSNWNTAYSWGNHASAGYLTSITSGNVTTALGYTPYNATNPNGYITGISFANVSSKPTTISGYGITDAITTANIGSQSVSYAATAGSAPNGSNSNQFYDVNAGVGNGLRFWNGSSAYKISMGVGSLYQYGPVTDYSIKAQMNDGDTGRGFTWGRESHAPIAALNSTSGDMEVAGYYKSYGYRGNGNVGGTGSASWHPDGIYCGSTMWQYGAQYKNNTGIYDVSEFKLNAGPTLSIYNSRNLSVRALDNNADVGILGQKSGGGFAFQIYGTGSSYGFLNGIWAAWDIRKAVNGAMYMNDNDSYYLQTNSTSNFVALNIQGNAVVHAGNIGSQSVSYATTAGTANAVAWTNVSSRPTALSQFTNDLGNYGGFLTSITAHSHAISDVSGLQTALDGKQASGSYLTTSGKAADSELIDGIDSFRIVYGDGDKKSTNFSDMNAYNQSSGFFFYNQPTGNPFSDWTNWINVMGNSWNNNYGFQIAHAFHSDGFAVRRVTNGSFASWRTIIDSGNIGSQSVSYASSAGSVAWTNVSSRPTALSQFSNDLGNYGGWITSSGSISGSAGSVTGLTLTSSANGINPDSVTQNQIGYNTSVSLFGQTDGGLYSSAYSSSWIHQIYGDFRTGQIAIRGKNSGSWQAWRTVLDSSNYTSYAPGLTGSGASGTWGISVTGNAATVGGYAVSGSVGANTVVIRDANNYIYAHYINSNVSESENPTINSFYTSNGDGWLRKSSVAHVKSQLGLGSMAYESSGTYQTVSGAINTGNIGSQSVSYATTSQQLTKFGDIYGQDWNSYYINGKMIVSSVYGGSGPNFPTGAYNYGAMLSYGVTGSDFFQVYFPENGALQGGAFRKLHYRTGWNGSWSAWKSVVDQEGQVCTIAGSNQTGIEIHSNVGYNQDPLTYFLMRGQADNSWKAFKVRLTGDAGGQDIEFRRIAENGADARMWYVPRGANTVNFDYPIVQPSDSRLKDNITPISTPVDKIKSLRGVEFDWNSGEQVGTHDVGLIAQDVEAVLPEAVTTQEDGYKNLAYTKVIPLLVEAMKEQQAMIEALKAEIELLKNK